MKKTNIHSKIRALRLRAGYTQKKLGELVGISDRAVLNWEQDSKPRGTKLMKLAELFGVEPEVLTNDELELPEWQPTSKAKDIFPQEFIEHLTAVKNEAERYLSGELVDEPEDSGTKIHALIACSLASIDKQLHELIDLLKKQYSVDSEGDS